MSGIPVYTSSPIKASNPTGTTPQTAIPGLQHSPLAPNPTPTANTASSSYPAAQPGTAAFPAPTSAAQRYAPVQPTPTTKTDSGPPAPQPGAVPTPLNRNNIPPPSKAGGGYHSQQTGAPPPPSSHTYPPQMSHTPPTTTCGSQTPSSSTSTTNAPSVPYPVPIPSAEGGPRRSLEHPPGYHQNVYASEQTSDQRRAQETQQATNFTGLGTQATGSSGGFESEGVWNTAKKWAQSAGEKMSVAEAEVWKKINKE